MDCFSKYQKTFTKVKEWYIVCFMTFLLLSRLVCFVTLVTDKVNGLCYMVSAVIGGILLVAELLINYRKYLRLEYYLLAFFLVICFISALVNREYGMSDNIKTLAWMAIQFFLLSSVISFGKDGETSGRQCVKRLMNCVVVVQSLAVTISFGQFLVQSAYVVFDNSWQYNRRQGFIEERLFGIFNDPNYAAVASLIVIIFASVLLCHADKKWVKGFYIFNIVMNSIYILLSGSRTAVVIAIIVLPVFTYFMYRNKAIDTGKPYHCRSFLAGGGMLAFILIFFMFGANIFTAVADVTVKVRPYIGLCDIEEQDKISLEREDTSGDISNNRFAIWSSVWEISADNRVVGLSPRNMVPYAKKNHPDSYIAETGYQAHNAYLALISGSGILGTIPIAALVIYMIYQLVLYIKCHKKKKVDEELILSISVITIVGISGMFLLEIFFVNTITASLFWMFTGITFWFLGFKRKENCREIKA